MKASRYVKPFIEEVDKWERTLSQILEVIEMTVQVQRQWMYLEVRSVCSSMNTDACTPLWRHHALHGDQLWKYHCCMVTTAPQCQYSTYELQKSYRHTYIRLNYDYTTIKLQINCDHVTTELQKNYYRITIPLQSRYSMITNRTTELLHYGVITLRYVHFY